MSLLRHLLQFVFCLILLPALLGCPKTPITPPPPVDEPPSFKPLEGSDAESLAAHLSTRHQGLGSWAALRPSLEDSLGYILKRPQNAVAVNRPGLTLTWAQLGDSVAELIGLLPQIDRDPRLMAERFQWLKVAPGTLLTGYYEPWLEASLTPTDKFQYPLYGVPEDLMTAPLGEFHYRWKGQALTYRMGEEGIEPYFDREAIDGKGALSGRGLEIAWAKDPVDVFFLQIQGSGRLVLPDGSVKHILYGGKNGHKYVSLGKLLINRGHVPREEMSMQRIRTFLNANPETAQQLMFENPSYVFFRLSDEGPYGSISSILTPRVSVAVDRTMIPLGSVLALKTALMDYDKGEADPFMSLVLAQDTGGAIKGTRMDLFCGSGNEAELLAGHLQEDSEVFMLVSKRVMPEQAALLEN
ncbi:MltA domain-containing protein [Pseudodesulfovibrio sp. zrk46]|uniref:murein transglycosylase A n=1 Tax=Pseudodesulfovibrio sp. zrk46 TaxID=2725288 RepID=UPI00144A0F61|nr:MltA domain-containing protein [Pseudodesulfovibrio sp. zrk46]QJB58038.1 transglycosylase [Pseudodesulfovibrio sp. zrk46]